MYCFSISIQELNILKLPFHHWHRKKNKYNQNNICSRVEHSLTNPWTKKAFELKRYSLTRSWHWRHYIQLNSAEVTIAFYMSRYKGLNINASLKLFGGCLWVLLWKPQNKQTLCRKVLLTDLNTYVPNDPLQLMI